MTGPLTFVQTVRAPGPGPAGLAWDRRLLWNADFRSGAIFGWNPSTDTVESTLRCPGNLSGLTWDGRSLWQSLYDEATIRRINPQTNDFDQVIVLTEHGWISGVAWDGERLWALAQQTGQLLSLHPEDGQVLEQWQTPVAGGDLDYHAGYLWLSTAVPMRYAPGREQFDWLADKLTYNLLQIDPRDGRIVDRIALDKLYSGVAWAGDMLWLASATNQELVQATLVQDADIP